ncbi:TrmH family RNA methyltransferase [Mucilaginibacter terrae]|uniref:TrmH family RNA methyltransferase n=1 Tax=Mucilaginibacter terrae TaxID=1955052 RepID=A0ABU3H2D8_9SPHI|nr:RNA methyltransferase [Mucilaginibacter terrae]MDT3405080.1 TrmH family RNA methyltransferase [Mucilaginibacter terrae]
MVSKSQISLIKSLQQKKFRKEQRLFVAEGFKSVAEFITSGYRIHTLYHTPAVSAKMHKLLNKTNSEEISAADLQKMSSLTTPQEVLAVIHLPQWPQLTRHDLLNRFTLVLDGVQDPGNLGTIIRTADWFGIKNIICSEDTVDAYNPKVVQATMGSLARVNLHYTNLAKLLPQLNLPLFGAMLDGENIYNTNFGTEGLIAMGNEGNGLRTEIQELITKSVTIPRAGKAESLNVAIATALFCSEISRASLK